MRTMDREWTQEDIENLKEYLMRETPKKDKESEQE